MLSRSVNVLTSEPDFTSFTFFEHPVRESVGLVLIFVLVAVSNAAGLSGAGSNIPIMLLLFGLGMEQAIPLSTCVAVAATCFRFIYNYKLTHPCDPTRSCIDYEVVLIAMPGVFLGSLAGVQLHRYLVPQWASILLFEIVLVWSISTTFQKCTKLMSEERRAKLAEAAPEEDPEPGVQDELTQDDTE